MLFDSLHKYRYERARRKFCKKTGMSFAQFDAYEQGDFGILSAKTLEELQRVDPDKMRALSLLGMNIRAKEARSVEDELFRAKMVLIRILTYTSKVKKEWGNSPWKVAETVENMIREDMK